MRTKAVATETIPKPSVVKGRNQPGPENQSVHCSPDRSIHRESKAVRTDQFAADRCWDLEKNVRDIENRQHGIIVISFKLQVLLEAS